MLSYCVAVRSLSCVRLCDPVDCSTPAFPFFQYLSEFAQTHVHGVSDAMQPSHRRSSPSPPASFPASGSFQTSQLFASGGQSTGVSASASVLPMSIQDGFPLGWTGWLSLQSKGLSRVFSSTTAQKLQFFSAQPCLWPNSHIHTWLLEKHVMWSTSSFLSQSQEGSTSHVPGEHGSTSQDTESRDTKMTLFTHKETLDPNGFLTPSFFAASPPPEHISALRDLGICAHGLLRKFLSPSLLAVIKKLLVTEG